MKPYINAILSKLTFPYVIILFFIIGFIVFGNALYNNFVIDDKYYIIQNPLTHTLNLLTAFGPNDFNSAGQYRPIPAAYFSFLYRLFGTTPFFYHLLQLILHFTVAISLYFVFRKFISTGTSLFLALVFLVHPMNVESVSYIAQTVNPLFFLFGIIPLLIIERTNLSKKHFTLIFSLLSLSLLTKETGLLLFVILLIYSWLFEKQYFKKLLFGWVIISFVYIFIRFGVGQVNLSSRPFGIADLPLQDRLIHIPMIMLYYLETFFFPKILAIDQQWLISSVNFFDFFLPITVDILFIAIITLAGFYIHKHDVSLSKPFLFFSIWFFIGLLFHLQIFPLDQTVSDRWFYFTMVGLLGLVGIFYQSVLKKLHSHVSLSFILSVLVILCLSSRTIVRNNDWRNAINLYTHDLPFSNNEQIQNNLGVEYSEIHDYKTAAVHYQKSIAFRPYETNLHGLGVAYTNLGDIKQAKKYFKKAYTTNSYDVFSPHKHHFYTYKSYASILIYYGEDYSAIPVIEKGIIDYPNDFGLWYLLAITKNRLHDEKAALEAATKAYNLDTNKEGTHIYTNILNNQPFIIELFGKPIPSDSTSVQVR